MSHPRRWSALGLPLAVLLVLSVLAVSHGASAQTNPSHPAHIHQGTCDNLGDIVAPLDNVSLAEAAQISGSASAIPVQVSDTEVLAPLSDILAGEFAINIHESDANVQEYIACGDIGGPVRGGDLVIGLRQLNNSGYTGVARLDEDDENTDVTIYLIAPAGDDAAAAPADDAATNDTAAADDAADDAAPDDTAADAAATTDDAAADDTAAAPAGQEVVVDIQNFAFNPSPIEISVGDTITWTNQDGVPHTATGQDRDLLQSGTIAPGASFSQTFTEPGEIAYFCEFHPNMNGTIIVQ